MNAQKHAKINAKKKMIKRMLKNMSRLLLMKKTAELNAHKYDKNKLLS